MDLYNIDFSTSHKYIYLQIADHVKHLILTNQLQENQKLPSVRGLSQRLQVNSNTVQRAYRLLEQEGYLISRRGHGAFVLPKCDIVLDSQKRTHIQKTLAEHLKELQLLGFNQQEITEMVEVTLASF